MRALPCPCIDNDALRSLPWSQRIQAGIDYDKAISLWGLARLDRRSGGWQWRLDMRAALRSWKHYAQAVRAARNIRIAA